MSVVTQGDPSAAPEAPPTPEMDEAFEAWAMDSLDPDEAPLWVGGTDARALVLLAAHSLSVFFGVAIIGVCLWLTHHAFVSTPAGASLNASFSPGSVVLFLCVGIQAFLLPQLIAGARAFSIGRVYMLTDRRLLIGRRYFGRNKGVRTVAIDGVTDIARFGMLGGAWMVRIYREGGRPRNALGATGVRTFRPPLKTLLDLPAVQDAESLERVLIEDLGLPKIAGPGVEAVHFNTPEEDRRYQSANAPASLEPWQRDELHELLVDGERVLAAASHNPYEESIASRVLEWIFRGAGLLFITVITGLVLGVAIESLEMLRPGSGGPPSELWAFATTGNVFAVTLFWTIPTMFFYSLIGVFAPIPRTPHLSVITDHRCISAGNGQIRSYGSASARYARAKSGISPVVDFCDTDALSALLPQAEAFSPPLVLKEPHAVASFIRRAFAGEE